MSRWRSHSASLLRLRSLLPPWWLCRWCNSHSHLPVRCARDPSHPRRHPAWSRRWDLVLHHAKVEKLTDAHGGPPISFIKRLSGNSTWVGSHSGTRFSRRGQTSSFLGQLTVSLYKLLMILKCYVLRKFLMRSEQQGVSDSWNSCLTSGVAVEVERKNEIPLNSFGLPHAPYLLLIIVCWKWVLLVGK